jgi:uncharacterized membrane protein YjgN (DUF898 family)
MATGNVDLSRMPPGAKLKCPKCGHLFSIVGEAGDVLSDRPSSEQPSAEQPLAEQPSTPFKATPAFSEATHIYEPPGQAARAGRAGEGAPLPLEPETRKFSFHGTGGALFGIYVVNIILNFLTLGIYHFWGTVKIRNYLYSEFELLGERFAYHGTGWELFIGWLKAMAIIIAGLTIINLLSVLNPAFNLLIFPVLILVIPFARVGARRYRMSRSSWQGIRFSFRGRFGKALGLYFNGIVLSIVTLGIYIPFFHVRMQNFWRNFSYFGNTPFRYDGKGSNLLGAYLLCVLLTLPTLGICWFWYRAKLWRYDWEHTRFEGVRFRSTVTGGGLLALKLVNLLLLVFTLALALPWTIVRTIKFRLRHHDMEGSVDLEKIEQDARSAGAMGEGLLDQMDIGGGLF